jgi:hypothetical protein
MQTKLNRSSVHWTLKNSEVPSRIFVSILICAFIASFDLSAHAESAQGSDVPRPDRKPAPGPPSTIQTVPKIEVPPRLNSPSDFHSDDRPSVDPRCSLLTEKQRRETLGCN